MTDPVAEGSGTMTRTTRSVRPSFDCSAHGDLAERLERAGDAIGVGGIGEGAELDHLGRGQAAPGIGPGRVAVDRTGSERTGGDLCPGQHLHLRLGVGRGEAGPQNQRPERIGKRARGRRRRCAMWSSATLKSTAVGRGTAAVAATTVGCGSGGVRAATIVRGGVPPGPRYDAISMLAVLAVEARASEIIDLDPAPSLPA